MNAIVGVVYRYYTADGKSYIGCTTNEQERRYAWNRKNNPYGGVKIANARKNLGLGAFMYERLFVILVDKKDGLVKLLESIEETFIKKFDSLNYGFNTSNGGRGNKGCSLTATHKENISKSNSKPVLLIDETTGVITKERSLSATAAKLKVSVSTVFNHLNKLFGQSIKGYKLHLAS